MNNFGTFGSKFGKYTSNETETLLDADSNLYLQLKQWNNLGDPKSEKDTVYLQNTKIIISDFKGEVRKLLDKYPD